jgi:putative ABC transport system permease protein
MFNDLRYSLRTLLYNPGFALTAILSIGLAIGANSTIFSCANGVLFRPLPVPNPSQVVTLRAVPPSVSSLPLRGYGESRISYPDFEDFRRDSKSFAGLAAFDTIIASFAPDKNASSDSKLGYQVSADFFQVLEVAPQLGRSFTTEESEVPGLDPVVVLSHDLWQNEFGRASSIIGRRVVLNNVPFTVVGVAPESFTGLDQFVRPEFYIPEAMGSRLYASSEVERTNRGAREFLVKGRLKPGVTIAAAAHEASALAKSLEQSYPSTNRGYGATISTELEVLLLSWPILGEFVGALFTATLVILLIACANVANLMLGRGRTRAKEIALRLSIGAGRARVVRLLLIESLWIALASSVVALISARFTAGILSSIEFPSDIPIHLDFHIDGQVLWFTAVVSAVSALLFGLLPAIQSTRLDLVSVIKAGDSDPSRSRFIGRYALVVVQIAGCMVLLMLAAQGRSNFNDVLSSNPGFRRDHRISMRFNPATAGYTTEQTQPLYDTLIRRAREVTGVQSVTLTSGLPMTNDRENRQVVPEGYDFPPGREGVRVLRYVVDESYFDTFGVPLLAGRGFRASDRADGVRVAVVNEAFAKQYLGPNPIGKRMWLDDRKGPLVEVVGVSMTGKVFALIEPPVQVIYLPLSQNPHNRMSLIAETAGDPAALAGPLKEMVRSVDPNLTVYRVRTMDDLFERSSVNTIRMVGRIYDLAATLGLVLALIGLYAVISYQVTRRTREVGIRMALGAHRQNVIGIFLGQAMAMSLSGVSMGLVLSLFANRFSESTLGSTAVRPALLAGVSLALLLTAIVASAIPAFRAARIDPQQALRQD